MRKISQLHFITTDPAHAEEACKGGVDWVQLRLKDVSYGEYEAVGRDMQSVCRKYNATFIINDNIHLALALGADGVHVGKEDPLPEKERNELLARGGIIGCTANTIDDFIHLAGKPVSYIGLGPYRFTETKKKLSPVLGLNGYRKIFAQLQHRNIAYPPVVGIGGITPDDVSVLMSTGLHGIAVSSAIAAAPNVAEAARTFKSFLNPSDKEIRKALTIQAPVTKVWQALTDPIGIREWFYDEPVTVVSEWKEGADIFFRGYYHKKPYENKGTILKYRPEQTLSYTYWSPLSGLPDIPENYSVIAFGINPTGGETGLTLIHSGFQSDTIYRHFNFFWTLTLDRLKKSIERA